MIRYGKNARKLNFEKVAAPDDASLVVETVAGAGFHCIYHYHPELELTYVVSGRGRLLIGPELTAFAPGDLALFGPNVPHFYVPAPEPGGGTTALPELRVMKFGSALLKSGLLQLPEFRVVARLLETANDGMLFADRPGLLPAIDAVFAAGGAMRLLAFLALLQPLAEAPGRALPPETAPEEDGERARIDRALRFIRRRFRDKLTLAAVAAAVGMEKESFRRFFRRSVRTGFSDYVTGLRLAHAQRLLAWSDRGISEIALESGFPNLSNFNRQFLKRQGRTPRDYRRHVAALSASP